MKKLVVLKKYVKYIILIFIVAFILNLNNTTYAVGEYLTNSTRVFFSAEVSRTYGNGDCILLENYDANGNRIYGLIDAGQKINIKNEQNMDSTVVNEFLKSHGVETLEFLIITHSHLDHNGDAITVLNNFNVKNLYYKEFDLKWSPNGTQDQYERIIKAAVEKNTKIYGVSYNSTISKEISPNASEDFLNYMRNNMNKSNLFEPFTSHNVTISFGSAKIQILNWEVFDNFGNVIPNDTYANNREIVPNENNNSLAILLTQGNKRALFSGDMNNLDENSKKDRIGDETRLKDKIGKVDLLKLGHHGYQYSNTSDFLKTLNPQYAVITNDIGKAYRKTLDWLRLNNVEYFYTTSDEKGVIATITENDVYIGFETNTTFKSISDTPYYIVSNTGKPYNYKENNYRIQYKDVNIQVKNWDELKNEINKNKTDYTLDLVNRTVLMKRLHIKLNESNNWRATSNIEIDFYQDITLYTDQNVTIYRDKDFTNESFISNYGVLSLGTKEMSGTLVFDGNKIEAKSCILRLRCSTLNIYDKVFLQNNYNKVDSVIAASSDNYIYSARGSAIYCDRGTINMYGGSIRNNKNSVDSTLQLSNKEDNIFYQMNCEGAGLYLKNESRLNMHGGSINNNYSENNSIVTLYNTNCKKERSLMQGIAGVGIYANISDVIIYKGEISGNTGKNNSVLNLSNNSTIKSINNSNNGMGLYISGAYLRAKETLLSGNKSEINTRITVENGCKLNGEIHTGSIGTQCYTNSVDAIIRDSKVLKAQVIENYILKETEKIVADNNALGGGITFNNSEFKIQNVEISENKNVKYGGAIYSYKSNGEITNSNINNNSALSGGGIFVATNNTALKVKNSIVKNNAANRYSGGGIKTNGKLILIESKVINNSSNTTGGGIDYTDGKLYKIKTTISGNTAKKDGKEFYPKNRLSVDKTKPLMRMRNFSKEWTNQNIPVKIAASDEETGISSVSINGHVLQEKDNYYECELEESGKYRITVTDNSGNIEEKSFTVKNIDKKSPTINGVDNGAVFNSEVTITAKDDISGVSKIGLIKNGNQQLYTGDSIIKVSEEGDYTLKAEDNAKNITTLNFSIKKTIDEPENQSENGATYIQEQEQEQSEVEKVEIKESNQKNKLFILPNTGKKAVIIIVVSVVLIALVAIICYKKAKTIDR